MTRDVVAVRPDTTVREIARLLLDHHVSAVPVLDGAGAPIGIVSEGDLIGREESDREARRDWWLGLLAEGEPLGEDFLSAVRPRERIAREVMSSPVVTIGENTDAAEIARLLLTYRIKRAPVMSFGKMVGIVSREDLVRALAGKEELPPVKPPSWLPPALPSVRAFERARDRKAAPAAGPAPRPPDGRLTAADFRRLTTDFVHQQAQQREALRRGVAEQRRREVAGLVDEHITDKGWRDLVHQAREAAEHGEKEFMLLRFPCDLCSDGGRAVNAPEPDWPATLRGEAAEAYLRWENDLKPAGFHIAARVLDFPGGMPGDIGLFLVWI